MDNSNTNDSNQSDDDEEVECAVPRQDAMSCSELLEKHLHIHPEGVTPEKIFNFQDLSRILVI